MCGKDFIVTNFTVSHDLDSRTSGISHVKKVSEMMDFICHASAIHKHYFQLGIVALLSPWLYNWTKCLIISVLDVQKQGRGLLCLHLYGAKLYFGSHCRPRKIGLKVLCNTWQRPSLPLVVQAHAVAAQVSQIFTQLSWSETCNNNNKYKTNMHGSNIHFCNVSHYVASKTVVYKISHW